MKAAWKRLLHPAVSASVMAAALTAGCSSGEDRGPRAAPSASITVQDSQMPTGVQDPQQVEPIQVQRVELEGGLARLALLALDRSDDGRVVARFRLTASAQTPHYFGAAFNYLGEKEFDLSGISLVDAAGNKLYFPLRTKDDVCLCTDLSRTEVSAGGSLDLYAVYPALPAELKKVTVRAPLTTPFHDVELGSGAVAPVPEPVLSTDLAAPIIRPLVGGADGVEQSVQEEGEAKSIRISADVLFAVDEAELNSASRRILKGVAEEVDASADDLVQVDGYTDDTGGDQHNQELSQRRAKAVVGALQSLVTRPGVRFQARGYGEADPVASNRSEEGRRLNRRVAVGFTRPAPARPTTAGAGAFVWTETPQAVKTFRPQAPADANDLVRKVESLQYDINTVHRDSAGLVSLVWTVTNKGIREINLESDFHSDVAYRYKIVSTSGVALIDPATRMSYGPLRDEAGVCLCFQGFMAGNDTLEPGERVVYASLYKLPTELGVVDVYIPFMSSSNTVPGLQVN